MSDFRIKDTYSTQKYNTFKKRVKPAKPRRKVYGIIFFIFILFILFLFTYVLPRVTVIVVPKTENIEKEFQIQLTTDKSKVNPENNIFAAEIIEANGQGEGNFKATGEKDIGDKAKGQAIFYNYTGRSQPVTPNIDLINESGVVFVVTQSITIPSAKVDDQGNIVAGKITAEIEAKEAGEKGNVGPGRINISALSVERQSKVYGEIKDGLAGGTSKVVTVVSQEDLDNAKEEIIKKLEPKIKEKIKKKTGKDKYVSDELINYDEIKIEQAIEAETEVKNFNMKLNLRARALVYNNKELRISLRNKILAGLSPEQTISETEFGNLEIKVNNFNIDLGLADLDVKAIFPVSEKIDLNKIKKNIMGKKEQAARRYVLSLPNVKDVRFMFSLSLRDTIPNHESRVKVKLGEIK